MLTLVKVDAQIAEERWRIIVLYERYGLSYQMLYWKKLLVINKKPTANKIRALRRRTKYAA